MNKKIAFFLILFMVGSWCIFADEYDSSSDDSSSSETDYTALWITVGVIGGLGLIAIICLLAAGDVEGAQAVNKAIFGKGNADDVDPALAAALNNPVLKHTALGVNKDKLFAGVSFHW